MNYTFKKIVKGTLAIFVIKLVLIFGVLIFQSCQNEIINDEQLKDPEFKTAFTDALKLSGDRLNSITLNRANGGFDNSNINTRDMSVETITMCIYAFESDNPKDFSDVDDIEGALASNTLIGVLNEHEEPVKPVKGDNDAEEPFDGMVELSCFELPVEPIQEALDPAIIEAKNYFYSKGFNDIEITEMLDGEEEYLLVPLVMEMVAIENNESLAFSENNTKNELITSFLGIETANASTLQAAAIANDTWDCAMQAIGIGALMDSFDAIKNGNKAILKKVGKKAIKKIASRFLGPIGVAIAVVDFAICMAQ